MYFLGLLNFIFVRIPIVVFLILLFFLKKDSAHRREVFGLMISIVFMNALGLFQTPPRNHEDPRKSKCISLQRQYMISTEMYNMDHEQKITSLDIPLLLKEGYLKEEPKPTPKCEYYSEGDLSKDGFVYCKEHKSDEYYEIIFEKKEKLITSICKSDYHSYFFENKTKNFISKIHKILESIEKIPIFGGLIATFLLYFFTLGLGFVINPPVKIYFFIFSIISLLIVVYVYVMTKFEIIKNQKKSPVKVKR